MKTEKNLHDYLRKKCKANNILFDKVESRSRSGFPDCFLAYKGKVMLVELKSPSGTGVVSPLQHRCILDLRNHGVEVQVIDSARRANSVISEMLNVKT